MARDSRAGSPEEELTEYEIIRKRNIKEIENAMVESGTINQIKSLSHKIKNDKSRKKINNKIKRMKTAALKHCNENTKKRVLRKKVFNNDKEKLDVNRHTQKHGQLASDEHSANIQCDKKETRSVPLSPGLESCALGDEGFSRHSQEYQAVVGSGYNCITISGKNFDLITHAKSAVENCFRRLNVQDSNLGCTDIEYRQDFAKDNLRKSHGRICRPISDIVITESKKKQNKILPFPEEIAKNNRYQSKPDETEIEVTSSNKENNLSPSSHSLTWASLTCETLYHFCVYVNEQNNKCVSGQNSTMCNMCGHPFLFRRWLTKHMANEHNMKPKFKCNKCSYITKCITSFRQHLSSQHLNIKLQCDRCSYAAKCMKHLVRHKKAVHDNIRAYRCFLCSFASKKKLQLDNHVKIHETNETGSPDVSFM